MNTEESTHATVNPPPLVVRWFHAIDSPIVDPIAIRRAKREKTLTNISVKANSTSSTRSSSPSSVNSSTTTVTRAPPKNWVPFSKRDNIALEKAYKSEEKNPVPVNEDHLFEVNISKREISPVYWEGPTYEVRRATWFIADGAKWLPCEENMANQIEQGYHKHKPFVKPIKTEIDNNNETGQPTGADSVEVKNENEKDIGEVNKVTEDATTVTVTLKKSLDDETVVSIEEKEFLLGSYLGQYVIYTSATHAWLLFDTPSAKIAKSFFTKLTNNQNLGGTRLIRGYLEVESEAKKKKEADAKKEEIKKEEENKKNQDDKSTEKETLPRESLDTGDLSRKSRSISPQKKKELDDIEMTKQQAEDYDNEESEEELRNIDQIIFVVHGIGQQMSERIMGQNFVHDVNVFRKTMKSTWPIAVSGTGPLNRSNGIQVLPILWRKGIIFGYDDIEEGSGVESDLGLPDGDDGCPTIDEITLDGAPNIRTLVSDVFLDIPLYLTSRYHSQMIHVVTKEINRVYKLFLEKNPHFLKNNGQVSILAHSLGSMLGFDILTAQPFTPTQASNVNNAAVISDKRIASLDFPVKNYFAIGSPLGMIMILRGHKMVSRKTLESPSNSNNSASITQFSDKTAPVSFVYPAADNIYNIFHKSDPVAYRLEPLVVRHYGAKLKPTPIPYIKGGLKSVLDHGFNVGNDLATRAGAMFESFKSGLTSSLIMRGLGFSKPLEEAYPGAEMQWRSQSDPELIASRAEAKSAVKLKLLNPNGRLDFYLQEGLLENTYISALSAHMSYWQDVDVAGFLIREVYKNQELELEREKDNTVKTTLV